MTSTWYCQLFLSTTEIDARMTGAKDVGPSHEAQERMNHMWAIPLKRFEIQDNYWNELLRMNINLMYFLINDKKEITNLNIVDEAFLLFLLIFKSYFRKGKRKPNLSLRQIWKFINNHCLSAIDYLSLQVILSDRFKRNVNYEYVSNCTLEIWTIQL